MKPLISLIAVFTILISTSSLAQDTDQPLTSRLSKRTLKTTLTAEVLAGGYVSEDFSPVFGLNFGIQSRFSNRAYWGFNIPIIIMPGPKPWPWPRPYPDCPLCPICLSCPNPPLDRSVLSQFEVSSSYLISPSFYLGFDFEKFSPSLYFGTGFQFDKGSTSTIDQLGDLVINNRINPVFTYGISTKIPYADRFYFSLDAGIVTTLYGESTIVGPEDYAAIYKKGTRTTVLPSLGWGIKF